MRESDPAHDLERAILRETPAFNAQEVAERTGVTLDEARRLWRALGFPEHGLETAFTDADAEALSTMLAIVRSGAVDFDLALNLTRAVGQTMARLADWEVSTLVSRVEELTAEPDGSESRTGSALRLVEDLSGPFEELLIYVWRRHLAAAVARVEALRANEEDLNTVQLTVGFADIVSFTALSNRLTEDRIGDLVELFESRCADVVATQRGRVIKSIGDSVLFVSDDPVRAYDIAEGIINVVGRDPRMPDVRLGLASGSVVMRLGDVFGPPVNLAARLTAVARRNRIIIDAATARLLPSTQFETRPLPARPVRGFGLVEPVAVRRVWRRPQYFAVPERDAGHVPYRVRMIQVQDIRLDPRTRRTWRGEEEVHLSRKEFDLLHVLMRRAGRVVSRDDLMRDVWQTTFYTSSKTIDVHLGWVRRKLGDDSRDPRLITTVRGQGLRFETGA